MNYKYFYLNKFLIQMRLLLNYKGINKIMNKVENYDGIVQFVHENFFLKMSKWTLTYIDIDGDSIALDSDLDVQTMLETSTRDHLKVYIKDIDGTKEDKVSDPVPTQSQEIKKKEEVSVSEEKTEIQIEEVSKIDNIVQEQKKEQKIPEFENQERNHCRWKEHWKKKMEEKMAKFVDERVESLIPCLTKRIEERMNKGENKVQEKKSGIVHDEKCTGCGISPIIGVRYKCTKCPSFNFCESCEQTVPHDHNMIKMRFLEIEKVEQKEQQKCHRWNRWNRWGMHCVEKNPSTFALPQNPLELNQAQNFDRRHDDGNLKLTKKCFRMSELFGGAPESYREFVSKNIALKFGILSQLYVLENGEAKQNIQVVGKIEERLEKLSFYFKEPRENFLEIIKNMPGANLKELIKAIEAERKYENIPKISEVKSEEMVEQKSIIVESEQSKIEEIKEGIEEVKEEAEKDLPLPPAPLTIPEEPKSFWNYFKKPVIVDVKKKNECIIQMKDLFGTDKVYEYIKFFDENSEHSAEEIINLYIEKVSQ